MYTNPHLNAVEADRPAAKPSIKPAAEHRVLAKCAIDPITDDRSHNRTITNPLTLRALDRS